MEDEIINVTIVKDEETGKKTLKFIEWTDVTYGNKGYWTYRDITDEQVNALLKICYPKWDGENQISDCCTEDFDGDERESFGKDINCPSCPHVNCKRWQSEDQRLSEFLKSIGAL